MNFDKYAKRYRDQWGFSIIPVGPDKKPLIASWLPYQTRMATDEEIAEWDKIPQVGIGVVTGKVSNLCVIDIDTEEGRNNLQAIADSCFRACSVDTPSGGQHLYFAYREGLRNKAGVIKGTDLRAEGGYVVAPPTIGANGVSYRWHDLPSSGFERIPVPDAYAEAVSNYGRAREHAERPESTFLLGRRDEDLFHLAHSLVKGGMGREDATRVVLIAARNCDPPFPEREAVAKVASAVERALRKERNLTREIQDFVRVTEGYFSITEACTALQIVTKEDRGLLRTTLCRMVADGTLERMSNKDGVYRRINRELLPINFTQVHDSPLEIVYPFGLHELVYTYPGNVIVVAGAPNAGKTAFCLDLVEKNQDRFKINYFNSEMGETELFNRLINHETMAIEDWTFKAYERSDHFDDVIQPDEINIVDYMEITDAFYKIAENISNIHKKMMGRKGMAVICIQKNPPRHSGDGKKIDVDFGRGGSFSLEKPRLYLAMDAGRVKIVKGKNWVDHTKNPNGLCKDFKLIGGASFIETSGWYKDEPVSRVFS